MFSSVLHIQTLPRHPAHRAGFTLVEIAIVLVIIGLIVGGVLVGRDLIEGAKLRAVVRELNRYQEAFTTFKLKYGALPGDIPNPTAYWSTTATPGNGDGQIVWATEGPQAWEELALANLIPGGNNYLANCTASGTNGFRFMPLNAVGQCGLLPGLTIPASTAMNNAGWGIGIFHKRGLTGQNVNKLFLKGHLYGNMRSSNKFSQTPVFSQLQAYSIDSKIDDGEPFTGAVRTTGMHTVNNNGATMLNGTDYNPQAIDNVTLMFDLGI